jgi:1-acylglycerone phosphate reductase
MSSPKKTVLITGTSSGIGHALATVFNEKGYHVLATARKTDSIADLATLGVTTLALDVDSPASIAALKAEVEKITGGKLDYLVNNAGMFVIETLAVFNKAPGRNLTVPALDLDFDDVESCFRTNLFGVRFRLELQSR